MKVGQFVIYENGNRTEIGRIKKLKNDKQAWIWYHSGDTAALTDITDLKIITNEYCIKDLIEKEIEK